MGAIHYYEKERVFKLDTPHTSYLIGIVDEEKFLGHIYYGAKITDYDVRALMRTGEAPFVPSQNNRDRSSFLDAFPMEYPGHGVGDYRESAISVLDKNGNTAVQPLYREHKIYANRDFRDFRPRSAAKKSVRRLRLCWRMKCWILRSHCTTRHFMTWMSLRGACA